MKLLKAEITGFGKYRQKSFDFTAGNQLFFGSNEAGKSTLYQFIQTMLFGFASKRGARKDYTPKDGTSFGGKLWVELNGQVFFLERYKQVNRGKARVLLNDELIDEKMFLKLISPLNQSLFQEVFTFQQEQLSQLEYLDAKNLHRSLVAMGVTGSKQVLDKQTAYLAESQKLFKPRGQKLPLNEKLTEWQQLQRKIQQKEQQENQVQNYFQDLAKTKQQIEEIQTQQLELEEKQRQLKQQELNWLQYEEWQQLTEALAQVNPQVDEKELQAFYQEYQQSNHQMAQTQQALEQALNTNQSSEKYSFYLQNEGRIQELLKEQVPASRVADEFNEKLTVQEQLMSQLDQQEANYGFQPYPLPEALSNTFFERLDEKRALMQELHELELKASWVAQQEVAPEAEDVIKTQRNDSYFWLTGALSLVGVSFFTPGIIKVILLLGAFALAGRAFYGYQKAPTVPLQPMTSAVPDTDTSRIAQTAVQAKLQAVIQALQQELPNPDWWQFTEEQYFELQQKILTYREQTKALEKLEAQLYNLDQQYGAYEAQLKFLADWLPIERLVLAEQFVLLRQFADEMMEFKLQKEQQTSVLLSRQLNEQETKQAQLLAEHQLLLQRAGISQPSEIPWWLDKMQAQAKNWRRKVELEAMLGNVFPEKITRRTLESQLQKLSQNNLQLQQTHHQLIEEQQRLQLQIQQLQVDGTLDELYQEASYLKSQINELAQIWGTNRLIATFLSELTAQVSEQQFPQLIEQASHFFRILTKQKYQKILLQEELLVATATQTFPLSQLSTGTKDQVIMAIRFGYLVLQKNQILSPVIIDDGWLHYDSQRKAQLAQLLVEFGQDYQVICLSSDQEMVSLYQQEQQRVVQIKES
ncbi:MAG: AAA family ATPase [Enterococcus sp.]